MQNCALAGTLVDEPTRRHVVPVHAHVERGLRLLVAAPTSNTPGSAESVTIR